ncbi:hypothetical protein DY000_02028958 [Brassica cretica]|uniref:Uncharacterized protein n=1 Tax=Brassica cretica TaxID=69181 RepID=A0ABQ7DMW7_BRACR|nr:hypothetical protein DY000_02028958 [Brassica cretica]
MTRETLILSEIIRGVFSHRGIITEEEDEQSSAIDKGRNFMGFEPISIDEVFTEGSSCLHYRSYEADERDLRKSKKDFRTAILERKKSPNRLVVDEAINDDNSALHLFFHEVTQVLCKEREGMQLFGCRNSILLNVEFGCYWLMVNASVVVLVEEEHM